MSLQCCMGYASCDVQRSPEIQWQKQPGFGIWQGLRAQARLGLEDEQGQEESSCPGLRSRVEGWSGTTTSTAVTTCIAIGTAGAAVTATTASRLPQSDWVVVPCRRFKMMTAAQSFPRQQPRPLAPHQAVQAEPSSHSLHRSLSEAACAVLPQGSSKERSRPAAMRRLQLP